MARKKKTADTDVPTSFETSEPSPLPDAPPDESRPATEPEWTAEPASASQDAAVAEVGDPAAERVDAVPVSPPPAGDEPAASNGEVEPVADAVEAAELKLVPAQEEGDDEPAQEPMESPDGGPQLIDPAAPEITTQQVLEAILFTADTPLTLPKIVSLLGVGTARDVKKHIESLNQRYVSQGATFRIEKIAGGYQMLTLPQFNTWLRRLRQSRQDSRFSAAALETLSVVAYKQPVTRADIEAIRGVAAGEMLNRLRELNLVKIVGRAEDVGRPMLYGTTKRFLEVFGLASLDELPQVEQLQLAQ